MPHVRAVRLIIKLVHALHSEPAKLARFRAEVETLIAQFFAGNRVRQTFLMTCAVKR